MKFPLTLLALAGLALPTLAATGEMLSTAQDQHALALTIYNDNLALVRDSRTVSLAAGVSRLAWREVSAQIRPETALLTAAAGSAGFRLLEQNFDFDLLSPQSLLDKSLGRQVTVIRQNPATGVEQREQATVLSTQNGVVLQFADRVETGVPGRLAFDGVPASLRDQPTLSMSLETPRAGRQDLQLAYLSAGLSWRADYVAQLNPAETLLDLSGWVTLTNQSGVSYDNARLQLVAGDVNRVRDELRRVQAMPMMAKAADMEAAVSEESLLDYHLYTLVRPTTLANNQTKQVALMSAARVPVRKEYLLAGQPWFYRAATGQAGLKQKVGVFLDFANQGQGLGVPLPRGIVRVYKQDSEGRAQFVGEDRIDHTPKNDNLRLKLGDAFDVTATRTQTDYRQLGGGSAGVHYETAWKIEIKNARKEAVTVRVVESIGGDWQILESTLTARKVSASEAEWRLTVPAEGKMILTWRARVRG
jgi:hypothetical protein